MEEARRRINQYEAGSRISPNDEHFFTSLFTLHSEYEEKKGPGIDHIKVERDFHNNRCLYIHRTDGTSIDCSWVHCIHPASQKSVVSMAFRRAVKEIVTDFKAEQLEKVSTCPILGMPLTYENSHASYNPPRFEVLLKNFLNQEGISFDSVQLVNPDVDDLDQRGIISSIELVNSWRTYHQENAELQLLSAEANLRKLKS
nr:DCL family protein [Pseudomonas gingeri]